MYFLDRGCVRTLRTLYVYATGVNSVVQLTGCNSTKRKHVG